MDNIIVTSLLVLAVIAVIEAVSLFCSSSRRRVKLAFAAVLPVFPDDTDLRERLAYLEEKMSGGSCCIEEIINIPQLKNYLVELDKRNMVPDILKEIILQSKVEFNYEDEDN